MLKLKCKKCNKVFSKHDAIRKEYVPKRLRNNTKKLSSIQERVNAKAIGGVTTIASGQTPIDKADVKSEDIRMECKVTGKKSYTLKLSELELIGSQAKSDEMPVFAIKYMTTNNTHKQYMIVPEDWFYELLEIYRSEHGD